MWSLHIRYYQVHGSHPRPSLPYCNYVAYTRYPAATHPIYSSSWLENSCFKKTTAKKKKTQGKRHHVISSKLPALAPRQAACQVGGWVGELGAAPQGEQLEVGSWLVVNPNLEEGEEGLHERGAGVEVGVGNWGCR